MAVHFHKLKLKDVRKETDDCVSLSFDIPENLRETFIFNEGQNITIKQVIGNEEVRRSYSICSIPDDDELRVAVKRMDGGLFSCYANDSLKKGDELEVLPPTGKFNAKLSDTNQNYLAIAAGSGITPIISIIRQTLRTQPESSFTLIYGNRSRSSIIFFEELEALKNRYIERFTLVHVLSRERMDAQVNFGRIDRNKLDELRTLVPYNTFSSIYICGPEELIFTASDYFSELGIDKKNVHFELFTTPGQKRSAGVVVAPQGTTGESARVQIRLDGRSIDFMLPLNGDSILDGALKQGADLPYACKGGVCCSCRAKLVSGLAEMDVNYALEEEEVDQGFILTCQAHPRSAEVVIDFDVK